MRDELNETAPRRLAVLDPLKLVVTTLSEDHDEALEFQNHPAGRVLRHAHGALRTRAVRRARGLRGRPRRRSGSVSSRAARCGCAAATWCAARRWCATPTDASSSCIARTIPTRSGRSPRGARSRASSTGCRPADGVRATVRAYDRLFVDPRPDRAPDVVDVLNPDSVTVYEKAIVEPIVAAVGSGDTPAVRAARLLRRRPARARPGASGVQPRGDAARHLGALSARRGGGQRAPRAVRVVRAA